MAQLRSYSTMALRGAAALLLAAALVNTTAARAASADSKRLQQLTAGPQRTAENKARDAARNPVPLLTFLKVTPQSRLIEILRTVGGENADAIVPLDGETRRAVSLAIAAAARDNITCVGSWASGTGLATVIPYSTAAADRVIGRLRQTIATKEREQ